MTEEFDKLFTDNIKIGKIISITDADNYIVKLKIDGFIDEAVGIPLLFEDEPRIDEEVYCISLNSMINDMFLYLPIRLDDFIGFRYRGGFIQIKKPGQGIHIQAKGRIRIANDDASLYPILRKLLILLTNFKVDTPNGPGITHPSMQPQLQTLLQDTLKLLK